MNLDRETLCIYLHKIIAKFICEFEKYAENRNIKLKYIYCEMIRRSDEISSELRLLAESVMKILDKEFLEYQLTHKLQIIVHKLLLQDFLECALNMSDDCDTHLSNDDVHRFLYICAEQDGKPKTPSSYQKAPWFGFPFTASQFLSSHSSEVELICHTEREQKEKLDLLLPSALFKEMRFQFDDDLLKLQGIFKSGFCGKGVDVHNAMLLNSANEEKENNNILQSKFEIRDSNSMSPTISTTPAFFDWNSFEELSLQDSSFLSWEGCLGGVLPEHSYTSELNPKESSFVQMKESQICRSYALLKGLVSEEEMVHDILDLLIGIPSSTFLLDETDKFRINPGVHLQNTSSDSTYKLVSDFISSGNIFHLLQIFVTKSSNDEKGLIMKGLKFGVKMIMTLYTEYIASVKYNAPNLQFVQTDVFESSQLVNILGMICGINPEKYIITKIPQGLGLLNHLHAAALSHKQKEYGIMIAVLLKYTYEPYFNFLNKWMTEGVCFDPYREFQIAEDSKYLNCRDSLYWKFAYTEIENDPMRAVPAEIKEYSSGILDCGKSIGLLKICCPELFSLKFLFCHPPPSLSMVFSFRAVILKNKESTGYIFFKDEMEQYSILNSEFSEDQLCIYKQTFIQRKHVFEKIQRKWNILQSTAYKPDIHQPSQQKETNKKLSLQTHVFPWKELSNKKFSSLDVVTIKSEQYGFSGMLLESVGLVFTSCGYPETTFGQIPISNVYHKHLNFFSMFFGNEVQKHILPSKTNLHGEITRMQHNQFELSDFWSLHNFNATNLSTLDSKPLSTLSKMGKETCHTSVPSGSFVDKMITLLLSNYGDTKEEVYSFLQGTSLKRLMLHNFNSVLNLRIYLIEKIILKYIVHQLELGSLLKCLRDIYFFQDEGFGQSLCQQLFDLVTDCKTLHQFAAWSILNEMLSNAIASSSNGNESCLNSVSINITSIPEDVPLQRAEFLKIFCIQFEVDWPLNIIIHKACIKQYMNVFSFLLEIEYLCWMLGKSWKSFLIKGKSLHLDNNYQYRKILLNRFDMDQLLRVIRNSVHGHLSGPLWELLTKGLNAEEMSIDALNDLHFQYLEKALSRCFLTQETSVLHELISVLFSQVYKFCDEAMHCDWELNPTTKKYEIAGYSNLCTIFGVYKQYQNAFLQLWIQNSSPVLRYDKRSIDKEIWKTLGQRL